MFCFAVFRCILSLLLVHAPNLYAKLAIQQPVLPCAVGLDTQGIAGSSMALNLEEEVGTLDAALKSPLSDKELTAITTLEREVRICCVTYAYFTSTLLCQHVKSVNSTAHMP